MPQFWKGLRHPPTFQDNSADRLPAASPHHFAINRNITGQNTTSQNNNHNTRMCVVLRQSVARADGNNVSRSCCGVVSSRSSINKPMTSLNSSSRISAASRS